jgi:hypothetical protein
MDRNGDREPGRIAQDRLRIVRELRQFPSKPTDAMEQLDPFLAGLEEGRLEHVEPPSPLVPLLDAQEDRFDVHWGWLRQGKGGE